MKIKTRDFGVVEIISDEIITFKQPIYGFEHLTKYVFLSDGPTYGQFMWLQSTEDENVCFVVANPDIVLKPYRPNVSEEIKRLIKINDNEDIIYWVIAVIPAEFKNSTVNLKSPIVINKESKSAAQIILDEDYPIREYLLNPEKRDR